MNKYKPGDKIPVKVGDRTFETEIDKDGIQRFVKDPLLNTLYEAGVDLNKLAIMYLQGHITQDEYLTFYTSIGYSVCGFEELSFFEDLEIVNPAWEE